MALWGEYPSLFPLSVALNTALAALSDFIGSGPRTEANDARQLIRHARELQKLDASTSAYDRIIAELALARGQYTNIGQRYDKVIEKFLRGFALDSR